MEPQQIVDILMRRLDSVRKGMKQAELLAALDLSPVPRGEPKQWSFEPAEGWRESVYIDGKEIAVIVQSPGDNEEAEAESVSAASKAWRAALRERCGPSKKVDSSFVRFKLPGGGSVTTCRYDFNGECGPAFAVKAVIRI